MIDDQQHSSTDTDLKTPQNTHERLPDWLRTGPATQNNRESIRHLLRDLRLETVCEQAKCPNGCECFERGTATFLILGDRCTRDCGFCAVAHGSPDEPDSDEPERVSEAVARLDLNYAVITSVTRDDLEDGGAAYFAETIRAIRRRNPEVGIEVLTPDFLGDLEAVERVLAAKPTVFNHNVETCRRISAEVRPQADFDRSLRVLNYAGTYDKDILVKSGMMLGLGETDEEIHETLAALRANHVQFLTLGQYLAPSRHHAKIARFVTPREFKEWGRIAREEYGFAHVASAPLVRSSYRAEEAMAEKQ